MLPVSAGVWRALEVRSPFDGSLVGTTFQASRQQLEEAIEGAVRAFEITRACQPLSVLRSCRLWLPNSRPARDEVAHIISAEAGKPIRDAEVETDRGVFTLETAAEEAKRLEGEVIPLDLLPSSRGRSGIVRRFPIGPIAGISPFNFRSTSPCTRSPQPSPPATPSS